MAQSKTATRSTTTTNNPLVDGAGKISNKLLAFSGGGWNSHSILAGLFSGMMQASGTSLKDLLNPYGTISGNSGGTWFLSHLAYSQPFVDALTQISTSNGIDSYAYNQQLRALFTSQSLLNNDAQALLSALLKTVGISEATASLISRDLPFLAGLLVDNSDLKWTDFVNKYVYGPAVLGGKQLRDLNLESPRLNWAANKDFVYALAAAASPAVINERGLLKLNEKNFAHIQPSASARGPWWDSYQKAAKKNLAAVPLLIDSDYNPTTKTIRSAAEFPFGSATINFKNNPLFAQTKLSTAIGQTFSLSGFNLINTTSGSSATYGTLASPDNFVRTGSANTDGFDLYNQVSGVLRKVAPLAAFKNGVLSKARESDTGTQSLASVAKAGLARLVDGGFVDNTSVAYAIRHLQTANGNQSPFNITLMMNSSLDPLTGYAKFNNTAGTSFAIAGSVMSLFGLDYNGKPLLNQAVPADSAAPTYATPSPQLFDLNAWDAVTGPNWSYRPANTSFSMDIYRLPVTTVANQAMGISSGQSGVFNIIATNNSASAAGPMKPRTLDEYDQNFTYARDAMIRGGAWPALQDLFTAV